MNSQTIRFNEYFNNWLYSQNGYYANYKQIGKEGDFYTSVSTSFFFGGTIAKRIVDSIEKGQLSQNTNVVEIGAHHGYLLADIIQFIYTLKPSLLKTLNFTIVEKFDALQEIQKKYLEESFSNAINLNFVKDVSELKLQEAFIIANEIFDAFPCDLVYTNKEDELQLAFVKNNKIEFKKCEDKEIHKYCNKYKIKKGEVSLSYKNFIDTLCQNINEFEFITFDYGDKFHRNDFSTRVYSEHKVFPIFEKNFDLEKHYLNSDITYDVDFNYLSDCFKKNNMNIITFKTQMQTLIEFGIIELLESLKKHVKEEVYLKELQKIKILLEPTGMGDRFKVLHVIK